MDKGLEVRKLDGTKDWYSPLVGVTIKNDLLLIDIGNEYSPYQEPISDIKSTIEYWDQHPDRTFNQDIYVEDSEIFYGGQKP